MQRIFTALIVSGLAFILAGCIFENAGITFTCVDWALNTDGSGTFYSPSGDPSEPDTIVIRITDGDGTTLFTDTFADQEAGETFISNNGRIPYTVLPTSNPLTFEMYFILDGTSTLVFEDSGSCGGSGDENIVYPPDDRINWQYGDLYTVVYRHPEGAVVYCFNGNAWLGMHITQAVVDAWDTSLPQAVPVLEVNHDGCRAAFYILDDGLYQINVWSYEGKIYEIIADNIHFDEAIKRYFDPNE
jgi:hypothetical protein